MEVSDDNCEELATYLKEVLQTSVHPREHFARGNDSIELLLLDRRHGRRKEWRPGVQYTWMTWSSASGEVDVESHLLSEDGYLPPSAALLALHPPR